MLWSEGWKVEDRTQEIFSQYELHINHTYRVRGALLLDTENGLKLLCSNNSSESRLSFEDELKHQMCKRGYKNTDMFLRNREGLINTANTIGERFIIKDWFDGEECSIYKEERIFAAIINLAQLHQAMEEIQLSQEQKPYHIQSNLLELFDRRNREMKRVMMYIRSKKQKSIFEVQYLNMWDEFYKEALKATKRLLAIPYEEYLKKAILNGEVCHGSYNYHNVLLLNQTASYHTKFMAAEVFDNKVATTNFEKAAFGLQIVDVYQFLRKVMEKNNWNLDLAKEMLKEYDQIRSLREEEKELLLILLMYPEKFWKLTNFYYNSKKSWIPQKNIQKLLDLKKQQVQKDLFLENFS